MWIEQELKELGTLRAVQEWQQAGINHGFLPAIDLTESEIVTYLRSSYHFGQHFFMHQVHGTVCLDLDNAQLRNELLAANLQGRPYPEKLQSDALSFSENLGGTPNLYIVRTADCIPALLRCGDKFAVIHAGWRGVVSNIIGLVIERLSLQSSGGKIELILGPSAGKDLYEVSSDVIEALNNPVYRPATLGKYFLDVRSTVAQQIMQDFPQVTIYQSDICTISDQSFYSYRRDQQNPGRNLSFIIA